MLAGMSEMRSSSHCASSRAQVHRAFSGAGAALMEVMVCGLPWLSLSGTARAAAQGTAAAMQKRWLFVWRDMSNPKEVERMIARFPRAKADGYNGVAFSYNVAPEKAAELKAAARQNALDLVAIVMGGAHDRNYTEGVLSKDALFVAHGGTARFEADNPNRVVNGDFEEAAGNQFKGWTFQDDEGVTSFADHAVVHGGTTSLRMESIGTNQYRHCRLAQPLKLQPCRQYHISVWVKTENLSPSDPEVKVLTSDAQHSINFQTFHAQRTQDWKRYDLVFNSLDNREGVLYLGSWSGKDGKLWWDDLRIEEIGLVNVLRRPGCPVTVRGEDGTAWEEGLDKDIGIVNWHGGLQGRNCKFFADLGLKQILSGYYDGDEDGAAIARWLDNTKGIPGIVGAMYTTWEDKYDAMDAWARKAWGGGR